MQRFTGTERVVRRHRAALFRALSSLAVWATPLLVTSPLLAQGARGTATTSVRYVTLRPIALDTVDRAEVTALEGGGFKLDGRRVTCVTGQAFCTFYRPADTRHAVLFTEDVSATAWGLGMRGLSATVLVRARADVDGEFLRPEGDDPLDAILAYAQLQRDSYRIRLGRQRTLGGLGFSGFDGLDLLYAPATWLRLEAYGGRSLARGLNEPRHDALRALESFVPDRNAWLAGGFLELAAGPGTSLGVRYQREIWANRSALVSERAAVDFRTNDLGPLRVDGAADYDFAFGRIGKARLSARTSLPSDLGWAELTARRYVPYFELWTIWGFFNPVAYHEAELALTALRWREHGLTAWASAGYRRYGDAEAPVIIERITDDAQRYGIGARVERGRWTGRGEYRLEWGFGAFLSAGDVELRWRPHPRFTVSATGTAFQQIEQFRVGENVVIGGGLAVDAELGRGITLRTGIAGYHQGFENRPSAADWNQLRAWSWLSVPFGADPGIVAREE